MHSVKENDALAFAARLRGELAHLWQPGRPVYLSRAPGRLDVMGGIADYSGSLVCEASMDLACLAAVQGRNDEQIVIQTLAWKDGKPSNVQAPPLEGRVEFHLSALREGGALKPAAAVAALFHGPDRWARYPVGVLWALLETGLVQSPQGFTMVISSRVPFGAGVASSAALEVATIQALLALYQVNMEGMQRALLCQRAENHVVGAPCGIMDQVTSLFGEPSSLLRLRCQPHDLGGSLQLPAGVRVIGLDSSVKHLVSGNKYTDARVGAFMGHKIIVRLMRKAKGLTDDLDPTGGYLARVTPEAFVELYRDELPTRIKGADFLRRFGPIMDRVTQVDPAKIYRVRSRAEHHVYENRRVEEFAELLSAAVLDEARLIAAGELMYASHWSYGQRCGLGSLETEHLVTLLRQEGVQAGIYGAKITGGGSGGTVTVLCRIGRQTDMALQRAVEKYQAKYQTTVQWFTGTGPGALAWGVKTL